MTDFTAYEQNTVFDYMPGFVGILRGPEHRYEYVNEAYREISGPREFIGRTVREVFPELTGQGFYELLDRVYATGEPYAARSIPLSLHRDDGERFIDFLYNPIRDTHGNITGIFVGGYDTTEAHRAQQRWRALAELSDRLQAIADVTELLHEAVRILGRTLKVSRVGYGNIDDETATLHVVKDWTLPGVESLAGATPLLEYGSFIESLKANEFIAIEDVRLDPRTSMASDNLEARSARSFVNVPVLENGRLVAVLFLNHAEVRHWREEELALIREVGERVTSALQRDRETRARRRIEGSYKTLFDALDAGFCVVEMKYDEAGKATDYRLAEINPAFEHQTRLYGAAGKWVSEAVPGLEAHWFETYGRVGLTGEPARFENYAEPFGRWYDVHAFRLGASEERRVAILFNDITDRKNAEDRLREVNAQLEASVLERTTERNRVWTMSRDLFAVMGFDGYLKEINPAWEATLGRDTASLLSLPFPEQVHPEDHARVAEVVQRLKAGETVERFTDRLRHADGSWRWISWTLVPETDVFYAVGRDITSDIARQEELQQAQEALRQSQKMEAVGQLTGGLAHDFNNIMAGIAGSLEMISRRLAQGRIADMDRYVTGASSAAKRATALTQRLLAFSRRQTLDPKPTDMNTLVRGMMDLINRSVGPQIEVASVGAADLWTTFVDAGQLENALLNLCINARDAMPDGGRLTIETANRSIDDRTARQHSLAPGQYVFLSVTDTGSGMTPEVMARAFDPFFTTKPIGQGTGLGLSMVYGFAGQSGGAVRISSELRQGTTVTIYLPRHAGEGRADEVQPGVEGAPRADRAAKVLVVDDEPLVRMIATEALEELGYTILEAENASEALGILKLDPGIDLLVTDVGLSGGTNGRQLADAARSGRPELKILFITGYAENAVLNHGHLDPGMNVLTKPFQLDAFARKVKDLIAE